MLDIPRYYCQRYIFSVLISILALYKIISHTCPLVYINKTDTLFELTEFQTNFQMEEKERYTIQQYVRRDKHEKINCETNNTKRSDTMKASSRNKLQLRHFAQVNHQLQGMMSQPARSVHTVIFTDIFSPSHSGIPTFLPALGV